MGLSGLGASELRPDETVLATLRERVRELAEWNPATVSEDALADAREAVVDATHTGLITNAQQAELLGVIRQTVMNVR